MRLEEMLRVSAARTPDAPAAFEPGGASIDYRSLDAYSTAIAEQLACFGVKEGDRVGLCTPKTIAALGSVFGVMKAGGAYVPVDYSAPATRNGFIFSDCEVRALIADRDLADGLIPNLSHGAGEWRTEDLAGEADRSGAAVVIHRPVRSAPANHRRATDADALAYILYTSGSTGKPKGVMHSHRTARAFIDWCSAEFSPTANDVFSSHAPFHFDLSILDLYVSIKHGASIVLIDATTGKQAQAISSLIDARGISIWYSTPSILRMLIDDGGFEQRRFPRLRTVIFAGEVYPPKQLAKLVRAMPGAALYNLYGPTETNVCTYYRTPSAFDELSDPLPIGYPCSGDRPRVVDADGRIVSAGEAGELLIAGGSVMLGYWNLPERNAEAFVRDAEGDWYRTGDIVRERSDGAFIFIGRRDRMVKRRGYRVELGEIEAALNKHPNIAEAAVIAAPAANDDIAIRAFIAWAGDGKPSIIEMKKHCSQNVPLYMVPDQFIFVDVLPKTSTDKIDYQTLKGRA
ncbi:MAG: amino acid adenylation domain-containing protein [Pseudomonadota bacterium]